MNHNHDEPRRNSALHALRSKWVLIGFLAVAAFFLWTEHRAHLLGALPYLILLACPLMHVFHHGGHGHDHHHDSGNNGKQKNDAHPPSHEREST
jgi:hypothetical protein